MSRIVRPKAPNCTPPRSIVLTIEVIPTYRIRPEVNGCGRKDTVFEYPIKTWILGDQVAQFVLVMDVKLWAVERERCCTKLTT